MWIKVVIASVLFCLGQRAWTLECDSAETLKNAQISKKATAGIWANLQNKPGSIKRESSALLEKMFESEPPKPDALICEKPCEVTSSVRLSSKPMVFLESPKKINECKSHLTQTQKKPLIFGPKSFSTLTSMQDWMTDFSQGKGDEGKQLYQRCPGDCSPQFFYIIDKVHKMYNIRAEVICGMARDKKDGMYALDVFRVWTCGPASDV